MVQTMIARLVGDIREGDERAQSLVEYALILALVSIVVLVVLMVMGNTVRNMFCNVSGTLG